MAKKTASLDAALVSKPNLALVVSEPQEPAAPSPAPVAEQPKKAGQEVEQLGIRVSPELAREFKRYAFDTGRKYNELFIAAFDALKAAEKL